MVSKVGRFGQIKEELIFVCFVLAFSLHRQWGRGIGDRHWNRAVGNMKGIQEYFETVDWGLKADGKCNAET